MGNYDKCEKKKKCYKRQPDGCGGCGGCCLGPVGPVGPAGPPAPTGEFGFYSFSDDDPILAGPIPFEFVTGSVNYSTVTPGVYQLPIGMFEITVALNTTEDVEFEYFYGGFAVTNTVFPSTTNGAGSQIAIIDSPGVNTFSINSDGGTLLNFANNMIIKKLG